MRETMTLEKLRSLVKDVVGQELAEQMKTFRQPATDNMGKILSGGSDENLPAVVREAIEVARNREKQLDKGLFVARMLRGLAAGKGDPERGIAFARKQWGLGDSDPVIKALAAGDAVAGGFIIPETYSADIIELLRPMSVVRSLNPIVMPMETGSVTVPGLAGGTAASYIGENQNLPKTEPTFRQLVLTWKKLAALVPISNDLLRYNNPSADTIVRDDLTAAIAQRSDLAFIRDDGSQFTPKGLRYWAPAANVIAANATINLANVTTDLGKLVLQLVNANVRMLRPGWIMAPRTWNYLMTVRDANGNFAFRPEMEQGRLWGWPFKMTTQIPTNLGAGSDESEIYFVDFADVVIGEAKTISIEVSTEAAYYDGAQLQAAFSLDQTVIRAIVEHDLVVRHAESVAILSTVKWS